MVLWALCFRPFRHLNVEEASPRSGQRPGDVRPGEDPQSPKDGSSSRGKKRVVFAPASSAGVTAEPIGPTGQRETAARPIFVSSTGGAPGGELLQPPPPAAGSLGSGETTGSGGRGSPLLSAALGTEPCAGPEEENPIRRAALPNHPRALPVVSLASLRAAFHRSANAIAVVRVAERATLPSPTSPGGATHHQGHHQAHHHHHPHHQHQHLPPPWETSGTRGGPATAGCSRTASGGSSGGPRSPSVAASGSSGSEGLMTSPPAHGVGGGSLLMSPPGTTNGTGLGAQTAGATVQAGSSSRAWALFDRDRSTIDSTEAAASPSSRRSSRQEEGPSFALRTASTHMLHVRSAQSIWGKMGLDAEETIIEGVPMVLDPETVLMREVIPDLLPAGEPLRRDAPRPAAQLRGRRGSSAGERRSSWGGASVVTEVDEGEQLARLEPVYINRPLQGLLDVKSLEEYSSVMEKQLLRNPMLVLLLENAVRRLLAGRATSARVYLPHFSSPSTRSTASSPACAFFSLSITACGFQDEELELTAQLKRDYMALAHIPSMVTVLGSDGSVLHQNGCSVAYMGFLMGALQDSTGCNDISGDMVTGVSISDPRHILRRLFVYEPAALEDMLLSVAEGKTWIGVVRVPPHLDPPEETYHSPEAGKTREQEIAEAARREAEEEQQRQRREQEEREWQREREARDERPRVAAEVAAAAGTVVDDERRGGQQEKKAGEVEW